MSSTTTTLLSTPNNKENISSNVFANPFSLSISKQKVGFSSVTSASNAESNKPYKMRMGSSITMTPRSPSTPKFKRIHNLSPNNKNRSPRSPKSPLTPRSPITPHTPITELKKSPLSVRFSEAETFSSPESPTSFKSLKQKRVRNLVGNVSENDLKLEDVMRLQEEISENKEKLANLYQQLSFRDTRIGELETEMKKVVDTGKRLQNVEEELSFTRTRVQELNFEIDREKRRSNDLEHQSKRWRERLEDTETRMNEFRSHMSTMKQDGVVKDKKIQELESENKKTKEDLECSIARVELSNSENIVLKKEYFFNTCLALKLNMSNSGKMVNSINVNELWEKAQIENIPFVDFGKWISNQISKHFVEETTTPRTKTTPIKQANTNNRIQPEKRYYHTIQK